MRTRGTVTLTPDAGTPLLFEIDRETIHLDDNRRHPVTVHEALTIRWTVDGRPQSIRATLAAPLELDGIR